MSDWFCGSARRFRPIQPSADRDVPLPRSECGTGPNARVCGGGREAASIREGTAKYQVAANCRQHGRSERATGAIPHARPSATACCAAQRAGRRAGFHSAARQTAPHVSPVRADLQGGGATRRDATRCRSRCVRSFAGRHRVRTTRERRADKCALAWKGRKGLPTGGTVLTYGIHTTDGTTSMHFSGRPALLHLHR